MESKVLWQTSWPHRVLTGILFLSLLGGFVILGGKARKSSRSQELAFWSRRYWTIFSSFVILVGSSFFPYILYTHSSADRRIRWNSSSEQAGGVFSKLRKQHFPIAMIFSSTFRSARHLVRLDLSNIPVAEALLSLIFSIPHRTPW